MQNYELFPMGLHPISYGGILRGRCHSDGAFKLGHTLAQIRYAYSIWSLRKHVHYCNVSLSRIHAQILCHMHFQMVFDDRTSSARILISCLTEEEGDVTDWFLVTTIYSMFIRLSIAIYFF